MQDAWDASSNKRQIGQVTPKRRYDHEVCDVMDETAQLREQLQQALDECSKLRQLGELSTPTRCFQQDEKLDQLREELQALHWENQVCLLYGDPM